MFIAHNFELERVGKNDPYFTSECTFRLLFQVNIHTFCTQALCLSITQSKRQLHHVYII